MSIDLEYAIKSDIRNNPVIRETDGRERREFRRIVLLASLAVGFVLFSAWQHFETLRYGYSIEQLRQDRRVRGDRQPATPSQHRDAARATEAGRARPARARPRRADRRGHRRHRTHVSLRSVARRRRPRPLIPNARPSSSESPPFAAVPSRSTAGRGPAGCRLRAHAGGRTSSSACWSSSRASPFWAVAIEARLVQLQVFQHDELETKARRHQQQRVPLEATRGDILDRNGEMLAYSVDARSIIADPESGSGRHKDGRQGLCRSWGLQREGTEGARGEAVTFDALRGHSPFAGGLTGAGRPGRRAPAPRHRDPLRQPPLLPPV